MTRCAMLQSRLRLGRDRLVARFVDWPAPVLDQPWPWRGHVDQRRFQLVRIADEEQECALGLAMTLAALGWQPSEAQTILGQAEISRGWLWAELLGVTDGYLDRQPAVDEWAPRLVLGHMLVTERRYRQRVLWHVAEAQAGRPTTAEPPVGVLAPNELATELATGSLATLRSRLIAERTAALTELATLTVPDLNAPTSWVGYDCDIRFRLQRFAAHERQHTVHLAKTLRAIGWQPSEAQRLLAQAEITRGQLLALLVGLPDELLDRRPPDQGPTLADRLEGHIDQEERLAIEGS